MNIVDAFAVVRSEHIANEMFVKMATKIRCFVFGFEVPDDMLLFVTQND